MKNDWIALVEASYDLDGSDQDWLDRLFDRAEPLLDFGIGRGAWTFRCTPTTFQLGLYPTRISKLLKGMHRASHAAAPARWFDMTYRSGVVVATGSELTYPLMPETMRIVTGVTGGLARDVFMAGAHSGTSLGVAFGVWLKEFRCPTAVERTRWSCISAHLGAGMRLRAATRRLQLDSAPVEAVLDSGGRVQHARAGAASVAARELLREAVRRIEKARTAEGRRDPDAAMDSWEGLVDGRWSLVDRFDTDGKRFVVAVQNDPAHPDPRGFTMCEREVAEFVGLGLPKFGRRVALRLARFDALTGELDLEHLRSLIDSRTKLVCCTGASNFLGTKNPVNAIRQLTDASGYAQPSGERRSYLLIDGAQLVPGTFIDFRSLGADYLAFSFHKILAPFGVGVLVAREPLLEASPPFLYGGDMVAEGQVFADRVAYNALPWKYAAGTPNIVGTIVSAQALRLLLDLALAPTRPHYFGSDRPIEREAVERAMGLVAEWNRQLTARSLERLGAIPELTIYGPRDPARRSSLVAFNVQGHDPMWLARALNDAGVEARAGCHCATLAHQALGIDASCR